MIRNERAVHENGIEMTYMINHFGPFYLTYLLFDLLSQAKEARIINVASKIHFNAKESLVKDMDCSKDWGSMDSYAKSKLANVMFAVSLADKLSNRPNMKAVSLHPGVVASDFYNGSCILKFFKCCCCCFLVNNERGAMASLHTSRV